MIDILYTVFSFLVFRRRIAVNARVGIDCRVTGPVITRIRSGHGLTVWTWSSSSCHWSRIISV